MTARKLGGLFPVDAEQEAGTEIQPHVYAYYFKQWRDFRMPEPHRHESTEIMFVMSGTCRVEVRDSAVELKKGEFIVIGYNVPHRLIVENSCRMLNLEFGFRPGNPGTLSFRQLRAGEPELEDLLAEPAPYLVLRDPDDVYHSLKSLVLELDARGTQVIGLSNVLFAQLLIRIARLREEQAADQGRPEDRYVRQSLDFLSQNYDRDIRVTDVASAVNLHPGYLQRIFKSATGRTLIDALTDIRMEKAKMLLKQTNIPVTEIYDYVGIGSRQYFHAVFKKHSNRTPLEYRQSEGVQLWGY